MPIAVLRDDTQRRFTATGVDGITAADILEFIATCRLAEYRTYELVFDVRFATLSVTPGEMREFAARSDDLRKTAGPLGPAAIVTNGPGTSALARLYERLVDSRTLAPLRVVASPEQADQWLATLR